MDSAVLSNLKAQFPHLTENYIKETYINCNRDQHLTITTLRRESEDANCCLFDCIISCFQALCFGESQVSVPAPVPATSDARPVVRQPRSPRRSRSTDDSTRGGRSAPRSKSTDSYLEDRARDEADAYVGEGQAYRKLAETHWQNYKLLQDQAHFHKKKDRHAAEYYFQQAKVEKQLCDEANKEAAAIIIRGNKRRCLDNDTIDLHYLFVTEAINSMDQFLDEAIGSLNEENCNHKYVIVITGKGIHSLGKAAVVKPAVMERLRERSLQFDVVEDNEGRLNVLVFSDSVLSRYL